MKSKRIALAVFAFIAGYLITTLIGISNLPVPKVIVNNSNLVSAVAGAACLFFVWKGTAGVQEQLLTTMYKGGFIGGIICFILIFVGALLLYPDCNICPVMSIFIAPLGFVLGLLVGWSVGKKKAANITIR
jgi:hypothetical protein